MEVKDLTEMEICGLQAVFPDIIKQSAPLVQVTLKKLLSIINDEQEARREHSREADMKDIAPHLTDEFKGWARHCSKEQTIKVGDTVRVSEDAPKMYYGSYRYVLTCDPSIVKEIEDGNAVIVPTGPVSREFAIPTKYLVKAGAEKEAKFKVGNWVMISGVFNPQLNGMIGWISRIDEDGNKVSFQDGRFAIVEDKYLTLIIQPTEQTEKKPNIGSIKIPVEVDLTDSYWQAYAAELAKEVALKVANKYNDPKEAAEYAVQTAEAVVAGLKRK